MGSYGEEEGEQILPTINILENKQINTMKSYGEEEGEQTLPLRGGGLKLMGDEYADKSLFVCSFEAYKTAKHIPNARYQPWVSSYVVRSINLSDLLAPPLSSSVKQLRKVANLADKDLPGEVGCGVLGSKIVFCSGLKPNMNPFRSGPPFGPHFSTDAYAFDVHDPKQGIVKMPEAMNGGKESPFVAEFAGKLYVLAVEDFVSFEVYDPVQGTWSVLPRFPYCCFAFSCAIAGTKLFMSSQDDYYADQDRSIWCFDLAARDPAWRRVPSMCQGGPLPFKGQALVVDLPQPEHSNKKLLFSAEHNFLMCRSSIVVHLLSLDENREGISEIHKINLPAGVLPTQREDCHFCHLGGNNVCFVTTPLREIDPARMSERDLVNEYIASMPDNKCRALSAAVPFQFDFDKVDKGKMKGFSVSFQPTVNFEYHHAGPDSLLRTLGCFVL